MTWNNIDSIESLDFLIKNSFTTPQFIFKHSTRCSISSMAKNRLESKWDINENILNPYYLDLLSFRTISDEIAHRFSIEHESPQILIIKNGACVYFSSHTDINVFDIKEHI